MRILINTGYRELFCIDLAVSGLGYIFVNIGLYSFMTKFLTFVVCSGFASPSTATPSHLRKGSFFGNSNGFGETQNNWYQKQQNIIADMKRVIEQQTSEIEKLKNENVQYQKTLLQTNASHEKVVGENKILKKAVTIQQERQNMAAKEVDNLRRENENANERIRRLEQMNSQLRFLVESSNMNRGFGFMDTRPPDVY